MTSRKWTPPRYDAVYFEGVAQMDAAEAEVPAPAKRAARDAALEEAVERANIAIQEVLRLDRLSGVKVEGPNHKMRYVVGVRTHVVEWADGSKLRSLILDARTPEERVMRTCDCHSYKRHRTCDICDPKW